MNADSQLGFAAAYEVSYMCVRACVCVRGWLGWCVGGWVGG